MVIFIGQLTTGESKNGLFGFVRSRSTSGNDVVSVVTIVEEMPWTVWWNLKVADTAARVGVIWLVVENWVGGEIGWNYALFGGLSNIDGLSKSIKTSADTGR